MTFFQDHYLLWKALHLISLIAWMAGLFYLPRLFVYHTQVPSQSDQSTIFKTMERKLLKIIMTPAMLATYGFGIALILATGGAVLHTTWFALKLVAVLMLSGFHGFCAKHVRLFDQNGPVKNERFYRLINELPTLLMGIIIFLVVFKPF